MQKKLTLVPMILNLFEGGEGAGTATGGTAPAAGEQSTGDLSQVVYGKQEGQPQATAPDNTQQSDADSATQTEERSKAYRDLIQGEYKDLYNEDVQRIVKNRLKGYDELKQANASQQEIIDRLSTKYGTADLTQLAQAIDNDTAMWEQEADKAGMTTEQFIKFQQLQRQSQQLMRQEQERAEQEQRNQRIQAMQAEAETVKQQYPNFDFFNEMENERFFAMIQAGVPMADAYRAMHFDELQSMTATTAARQAETAVAANVRANGLRPKENGARQQSSFTVKSDPSKFTRQDRAEIARRVANGETIIL